MREMNKKKIVSNIEVNSEFTGRSIVEIPLPAEAEKNRSIQLILSRGMPEKQRLSSGLASLWRNIGPRHLFFGVGDCVFLSILAAGLFWLFLFGSSVQQNSIPYVLLFLSSPFLYGLMHVLTVWKEFMTGTYEWMMTCRCSLRQLTVMRMILFGGLSAAASVAVNWGLWLLMDKEISMVRMMSISFSGLFLFGVIQLLIEWKWSAPGAYALGPAIWIGLGGLLLWKGELTERFLFQIPTVIFWIAAAGLAAFYGWLLTRYYFETREGGLSHAVS